MVAIEISDVKGFMGKLLASDEFDEYLILEAVITKANTFTIDGRLSEDYLSGNDGDSKDEGSAHRGGPSNGSFITGRKAGLQKWGNVRNICFEIVKGKTLPSFIKVVLQLPTDRVLSVISASGSGMEAEALKGLYLNITYDRGELRCVTGISLTAFTLDKSLEHEWDAYAKEMLKVFL